MFLILLSISIFIILFKLGKYFLYLIEGEEKPTNYELSRKIEIALIRRFAKWYIH